MIKSPLEIEYEDVQEQMRGISPKLSLHGKLKDRLLEIEKKLGFRPAAIRTRGMKRTGKNGKNKLYYDTRQRV